MDLIPYSISENSLEAYLINISTRSKIIYWIIIWTIILSIGILPFVYVDVSVQTRGYFQSDIEKQFIYTPYQGKIIYTRIRNGVTVRKGDTLLVLDTEPIRALRASLLQQIKENNASIKDLERLTGSSYWDQDSSISWLLTQRYRAEVVNLRSQQAIQLKKYQKKKSEHDRNELLFHQQIIAKADFENSLFQLNSERDNLTQLLVSQESVWQNDLTIRRNESIKLIADLKQCAEDLRERFLLAPTDGEIIQSSDIQ